MLDARKGSIMSSSGDHEHADREALESLMSEDLRALTAETDRIGRVFAGSNSITPNDFHALLHIMVAEAAGTPLSSGDLRRRMGVSGAAVTYLVERMITAGHIRRDGDPSDRRKVLLRYEPNGSALAHAFFGTLAAHLRVAMADLGSEDLAMAHRVFDTLMDGMCRFQADLAARRVDGPRGEPPPPLPSP